MLIRENRPTINFLDSYRAHYGGQNEEVVIQRLEPVGDQRRTIRLALACRRPDFRQFLFSVQGSPEYPAMNNEFIIRFGDRREWEGTATPVYERERGSTRRIAITLRCAEDGPAAGAEPLPDRYTVRVDPPLEFEVRPPESWMGPLPTEDEKRFAAQTWGAHLAGARTDYEKAQALGRALCHELWPHNGTPIPEMEFYSPFDMYRAMVSGRSKGFCVQFNMIFVHACKCFGVIARDLHIERPVHYGASWIFLSGMHSACEVFDRGTDRWIFMDIRFYCLGAYLGDEGPLSMGEFHLLMSQPHWRDRLRFHVYDMAGRTERRLPMRECPRPDLHFYSGWNTVFHVGYE